MKRTLLLLFLGSSILSISILHSCKKDSVIEEISETQDPNGVSLNLHTVPYDKLSDYRFFVGELKNQEPNSGVLPFEPSTPLFTDYALKKRFIWMPKGKKAKYVDDEEILNLPIGAILIKNFYYNNVQPTNETKILETRLMIRKSNGWIFAEYIWNEEQTEAFLNMSGSSIDISWVQDSELMSTSYRIPSATECLTCHKNNSQPIPIGIKPQNLNFDLNYDNGIFNQLQKLVSVGYLENNIPGNIVSTVNYKDQSQPLDLRFRSYIDMNCAHCHSENSHCDYRPLRLSFAETSDPLNLGLCVEPEEYINSALLHIISPSNKERSMMYFRMNSTEQNVRMPLLGRTLVHTEGVQLLEDWINSKEDCN